MPAKHALTVRLPEMVYEAARKLAERQGISLNRLVQEAIVEKAERSAADRLREAYERLAEDSAETDVEEFLGVQVEALLDG